MELLKYVYFCAKKSIIKAGNNKFQDLINAPRILQFSTAVKIIIFMGKMRYLSYFCLKHRLCVHVRTAYLQSMS